MRQFLVDALATFDWFVLCYFLVLNTGYLVLIIIAARQAARGLRRPEAENHNDIFANPMTPPISVVIGAYNEEACIVDSVRAVLRLRYPRLEVVVVDDGSTDHTFQRLRDEFGLVENATSLGRGVPVHGTIFSVNESTTVGQLTVVRKTNAGTRADALNAGLNAARYPLVCCIDADSILDRDALLSVVRPFVDDPERVIATGGTIRAINGSTVFRGQLTNIRQPKGWLARIQVVEYSRSFLLGRASWSQLRGVIIISGAFGLYRRDLLVEIGGFDQGSLGEDADAIMALHRLMMDRGLDYRIESIPEPVCWTEVPSTGAVLGRQRSRWSHGLAQVLWKYRKMIGRRRYGRIGLLALPYYLVFELLGAVVELVGVAAVIAGLALGVVDVEFALLFAVVAIAYGIAVSVSSLLVEEVAYHRYRGSRDIGIRLLAAILENVGFRQLHAWWRIRGLARALLGRQSGWGEMTRTGFTSETSATHLGNHYSPL